MSAYLIFDCESVPDGRLVRAVKYPHETLSDEEAVARAQKEALEQSDGKSEFLPVTFQIPVAVAIGQVGEDLSLDKVVMLDDPAYRPGEITRLFWKGIGRNVYHSPSSERSQVISFNGRAFDFPLMELAAFRYGVSIPGHFDERYGLRDRFAKTHLDLMEFFTNYGSLRYFNGGLDMLAKLIGKPGKMATKGQDVYRMWREGQIKAINEYCTFDVLDTYFVFLRSRVMAGAIPIDQEQEIVGKTKQKIAGWAANHPHFQQYLDHWGDWVAWP